MELKRLSAGNISVFFNTNIYGLLTALKETGKYEIDNIIEMTPLLVPWDMSPFEIKSSVFDKTEKILYDIDSIVDWVNPYSRELFEYTAKNGMLYPFVKRWFDWYEYNEGIINREYEKQQYLFVSEPNEQVYDINGDLILTLEGYFN